MADLVHADSEGLPACFGLRPDDAVHLADLVREIDLSAAERGIARLDFAHVEHIVDKAQQMLTGALHLADVLLELFGVVLFVRHQARDAHDGIHRGADVMRHIGKELALGAACVLRSLFGAFRRLHRLRKLLIDLFERLTVFPFQFERLYLLAAQDSIDDEHRRAEHNERKDENERSSRSHERNGILRNEARRHEEQQHPVRAFHAIEGVVVFLAVQNGVRVAQSAAFQLVLRDLKRGAVQILHLGE